MLTSQEIAERLNLSLETVDAIAKNLLNLHWLDRVGPGVYTLAEKPQLSRAQPARTIRSLTEDVYVAVREIWFATRTSEERCREPLRSFVLGEGFVGSLARSPVEMRHVVYTILLITSGHPSGSVESVPSPLTRRARETLQPRAAWWRRLVGAGGPGIHYVELGNGTLEFLTVAPQHERPDPAESQRRGVHG
jgi:hypothetical protein